MKIFFDMDDTLVKFSTEKRYLERMFEKDFFRNLKPYKMAKELDNYLATHLNNEMYILSACVDSPYCEQEKLEWVKQHIPHLRLSRVLLCKVGENKAEMVANLTQQFEQCYLIDDYSRNIEEWNAHSPYFNAIKRVNGFNNKSGRNYTFQIRTFKQLQKLFHIAN